MDEYQNFYNNHAAPYGIPHSFAQNYWNQSMGNTGMGQSQTNNAQSQINQQMGQYGMVNTNQSQINQQNGINNQSAIEAANNQAATDAANAAKKKNRVNKYIQIGLGAVEMAGGAALAATGVGVPLGVGLAATGAGTMANGLSMADGGLIEGGSHNSGNDLAIVDKHSGNDTGIRVEGGEMVFSKERTAALKNAYIANNYDAVMQIIKDQMNNGANGKKLAGGTDYLSVDDDPPQYNPFYQKPNLGVQQGYDYLGGMKPQGYQGLQNYNQPFNNNLQDYQSPQPFDFQNQLQPQQNPYGMMGATEIQNGIQPNQMQTPQDSPFTYDTNETGRMSSQYMSPMNGNTLENSARTQGIYGQTSQANDERDLWKYGIGTGVLGAAELGVGLYNAYQTRNDVLPDYSLTPEMQRSTSEAMARRGQGFTASEWAGYENKLASDTLGKWNRAIESAGGQSSKAIVSALNSQNSNARNEMAIADANQQRANIQISDQLNQVGQNLKNMNIQTKQQQYWANQQATAKAINAGMQNVAMFANLAVK